LTSGTSAHGTGTKRRGMSMSAQLQNLANMHASGKQSDEDYAAAKKKLLS